MSNAELVIIVIIAVGVLNVIAVLVSARVAEWRNPPVGRFIEVDGLRLHYLERGRADAPAVVLFHGNGAMIQDVSAAGLIDRLAERYRVICFDRPGFGYTSRPRLPVMTPEAQARIFDDALERLNVRNPVVFGHSWGTLVALALALRLPESQRSVKGLVLAAGYYFPTFRMDIWLVSGPAVPVFGDVMSYTISPILGWLLSGRIIRSLFAPREVPRAFEEGFPLSLSLRPRQLRATAEESALMIPAAARLQHRYRNLPCPLVLYHSTCDAIVEAEQAPRLERITRASALHTVQDAGHMLHYAIPDEIVGAIDDMMDSLRLVEAPKTVSSGDAQMNSAQRNAR